MAWPEFLRGYHRAINPVALRVAGRVGSLAVLEHIGRRTGATHRTPVRAFRRGDTVAVGVNFGAGSQWVRNVLAAGGCTLTLRGHRLRLVDARLVGIDRAAPVFPWWYAAGLRVLPRTEECLLATVAG